MKDFGWTQKYNTNFRQTPKLPFSKFSDQKIVRRLSLHRAALWDNN